jgi:hypothetical protein
VLPRPHDFAGRALLEYPGEPRLPLVNVEGDDLCELGRNVDPPQRLYMDDAIGGLGCRRAAAQYGRMCAMKSSGYLLLSPPAPPDGPGQSRWRLCGTLRCQGLFDHTA